MKKVCFWSGLLAVYFLVLAMVVIPRAAFADNQNAWSTGKTEKNVKYIDENGVEQICPEARVLGNGVQKYENIFTQTKYYDIDEGWYVVYGNAYFYKGWKVNGDVHVILADSCKLKIDSNDAGILVNGNSSITIYAQSTGDYMGSLNAYGGDGAGIGGDDGEDGEHITINGGRIFAQAQRYSYSAGIGGGDNGRGNDIVINGGYVYAQGNYGGAGIGGGANAEATGITINGGEVHAIGGGESDVVFDGGAGIGGGDGYSGTTIGIYGGRVYATGGGCAAGIGGGNNGNGRIIKIKNAYVEANGGIEDGDGGAGIGGGDEGNGDYIQIFDGAYVVAKGEHGAAGIGGGDSEGRGSNISIFGGHVEAYGGEDGAGIGGGDEGSGYDIFLSGGFIHAVGNNASSIGSGNSGAIRYIYLDGMTAITRDCSSLCRGLGRDTSVDCSYFAGTRDVRVYPTDDVCEITYSAYDEEYTATAVRITSAENNLLGGWYFVDGAVTIDHYVDMSGGTNIILCDGCDLQITGEEGMAAIVCTGAYPLSIYGQEKGTGILSVRGGKYSAGIGGCYGQVGGNISIYGGIINAWAGEGAAAIGGGRYQKETAVGGDGYNITIAGGQVNAYGGNDGAGIGGGMQRRGINISVYYGTVNAVGGYNGAGIGGGIQGGYSDISLLGGSIHCSTQYGPAIGHGYSYEGDPGNITLYERVIASNPASTQLIKYNSPSEEFSNFFETNSEVYVEYETCYPTLNWQYKNPANTSDDYEVLKSQVVRKGTAFTEEMLAAPEGMTGYWSYLWYDDPEAAIAVGDRFGESSYAKEENNEISIYFIGHDETIEYVKLYRHVTEEDVMEDEILKGEPMNLNSLASPYGVKVVGWYYDEEFQNPAFNDDIITEDTHLYLKTRMNQLRFGSDENADGTIGSVFSFFLNKPILIVCFVILVAAIVAAIIYRRKKLQK